MTDDVAALLRWLHAHDLPREVVLACEHAEKVRAGRRRQVVEWRGCLKDASIGVPAQLLALGIERVSVVPCPVDEAAVRDQVERWKSLTPGLVGDTTPPKRRLFSGPDVLTLGKIPVPRRVVLGLALRDTQPIPIKADDTTRTLAAIELLTGRGLIRRGEGLESKLGGLRLGAAGCTACGVCVQACPHRALELTNDGGGSTLWQHSELCRGEQHCVQLCPAKALWVQGDMRLADLLDDPRRRLAVVASVRCSRCGAPHPAEEGDMCQVCAYRSANPFGSMMPPSQV
ncbi:4Fe-4S dicluster domain-containing protein [Trueperella pyogenes]